MNALPRKVIGCGLILEISRERLTRITEKKKDGERHTPSASELGRKILSLQRAPHSQSGSEGQGKEAILEEEGKGGTTFLSIQGFYYKG